MKFASLSDGQPTEKQRLRVRFFLILYGALISGIVLTNGYRAATQSITIDEAYSYLSFVRPPLATVLTTYDANHHVLYSLLAKLSTTAFGTSEFTLRLPSLLGGLLYLVVSLRLILRCFGYSAASLAVFILLSLNPLILDFLSAARGYGLALGLMMVTLDRLAGEAVKPSSNIRSMLWAGMSGGLSIAANLIFVIPIASLGATFLVLARPPARKLAAFVAPVILLAVLINAGPLAHAHRSQFGAGWPQLGTAFDELAKASLVHHGPELSIWRTSLDLAFLLKPALKAGMILVLGYVAFAFFRTRRASPVLLLCGGAALLSFLTIYLGRVTLGISYPESRMAIYLLPLLVLTSAAIIATFPWLRIPGSVLASLIILQLGLQLCVQHYAPWTFNAGVRRIATLLRVRTQGSGHPAVIVSSPSLRACLIFYQEIWRVSSWVRIDALPVTPLAADYLVLDRADAELSGVLDFTVMYRDPISLAVVGTLPPDGSCDTTETPIIEAVVNSASFQAVAAAGSLMSIRGRNFQPRGIRNRVIIGGGQAPRQIGCVSVKVAGQMVPLTSATGEEIGFQMPLEIRGTPSVEVMVGVLHATASRSRPFAIGAVADRSPALFTHDGIRPDALLAKTGLRVGATNPARSGDIVSLFGTGFGPTVPPNQVGSIAQYGARLQVAVSAEIGGRMADVLYAGASPGSISGVCQLNVAIPSGIMPGLAELRLTVGGDLATQKLFIDIGQ